MWMTIAILLPVGFVAAVLDRPEFPVNEFNLRKIPDAYPQTVKSTEGGNYRLKILKNDQGKYQLELLLKKPLNSPSPTLYLNVTGKEEIKENTFVGEVEGRGLYRFPLADTNAKGVFFYCNINKHPIQTILF